MNQAGDHTLKALRAFLKGAGDGGPIVTIEEWLVGLVSHGVLGKYPLHIFTFLPAQPDVEKMTLQERQEIALAIAESFIGEKLGPPELKKIAITVGDDKGLKYYLYTSLKNWVKDLIRKTARHDDALHLGIQLEKLLHAYPNTFVELAAADNWRESLWSLSGVSWTRKLTPNDVDAIRARSVGIKPVDTKVSTAVKYRPRLISTEDLFSLTRYIFTAVGEPMSVFEIWSVAKIKVPLAASGHGVVSLDSPNGLASDLTLADSIADPNALGEDQLLDRYDMPSCAARFLEGLDDMDLNLLREILAAVFMNQPASATSISRDIADKCGMPLSTFYFRRDRLKRGLSDILAERDEMLFYEELRRQLESRANVTFRKVVNWHG